MLSLADQRFLLEVARQAIVERSAGTAPTSPPTGDDLLTDALRERRAAFVTLKTPGAGLRGCMGTMEPEQSLHLTVWTNAARAAFEDPRFPPLDAQELGQIRIEISALTATRALAHPSHLVLGRDGVELRQGARRAVFLPQVAVEHGWDTDRLLTQLALKAGLEEQEWRDARLGVFQAEVFGERGKNRSVPG